MITLTEIREDLFMALQSLRSNLMRSTLTTLGIVIGIVSVTLMGTAIEGLNRAFMTSIAYIGADVLYIQKFPWVVGEEWWRYRNRKDITLSEEKAIEEQSTYAVAVAPFTGSMATVKYEDQSATGVVVVGSNQNYALLQGASVAEGRFLTEAEVAGARPVVVLGSEVAQKLFPRGGSLGKLVKVGGHSFRVVGVLEKMGNFLGLFSLDTRVVIPISQYFQHFKSYHSSIDIGVKIRDVNNLEDAREELRGIMRKVRHVPPGAPDDFAINQQELLINTFNSIGVIIAAVGLFITGLALTVGGIGIMNIMFVSVTERTREIGIRKALGARRITILVQFLIESAAICLFGGLIGLAIAFPMSILIDRWVLPTAMPVSIVVVAIFVSLAVGIISGLLPAYRASKLDPVEALRYE